MPTAEPVPAGAKFPPGWDLSSQTTARNIGLYLRVSIVG